MSRTTKIVSRAANNPAEHDDPAAEWQQPSVLFASKMWRICGRMAADAQLTTSRRLVRLHPVWPPLWRFGTIGARCQRRCHLLLRHTLRGFHQSAFWKMLWLAMKFAPWPEVLVFSGGLVETELIGKVLDTNMYCPVNYITIRLNYKITRPMTCSNFMTLPCLCETRIIPTWFCCSESKSKLMKCNIITPLFFSGNLYFCLKLAWHFISATKLNCCDLVSRRLQKISSLTQARPSMELLVWFSFVGYAWFWFISELYLYSALHICRLVLLHSLDPHRGARGHRSHQLLIGGLEKLHFCTDLQCNFSIWHLSRRTSHVPQTLPLFVKDLF